MTILDEIFAHKRAEVAERRAARPMLDVRAEAEAAVQPRDFVAALREKRAAAGRPALIAEVKARSPSRGQLAAAFDPLALAQTYAANGAAALSVLTDLRYFGGSLEHLRLIAATLDADIGPGRPPLLRKDFLCDPYQVYEARVAGADAILLIVAHLSPVELAGLRDLAGRLGMVALVEVHSEAELETALGCGATLIGINNRDLRDFHVDLNNALRLRPRVPTGVTVVAESGIHTPEDAARLAAAGVDAVLIGEALVTAPDVAAKVREMAGYQAS